MANETSGGAGTVTRAFVPPAERAWLDRYGTWQRFHRGVRRPGASLLRNLPRYARCVLVGGCQRSGTTMVTRLIAGSSGFTRLALTTDDNLDAALVLAGLIDLPQDRRYCFSTAHLNERFAEYRALHTDQRLIWVLRNPYSVVFSMLHNWRRFGLNELYQGCGVQSATSARLRRTGMIWPLGPSRIEKACLAYRGKVAQILAIRGLLLPEQLLTVDYDHLITSPLECLPRIFAFVEAPYDVERARQLRADSVNKADRLSASARRLIEQIALPTYRECLRLTVARS
jgi:hypothetical protein